MRVVTWNVNSLRNAEDKFLNFLSEYSPDIVLIQELRGTDDQLSMFLRMPVGYLAYFNPSGRPGYAGSALYYKDTLKLSDVTNTLNNEVLDMEGRAIGMDLDNIKIVNFYTPNGSSKVERQALKMEYYKQIKEYSRRILDEGRELIIGGDLNVAATEIDLYQPEQAKNSSGFLPEERAWFSEMLELGMSDALRLINDEGGSYTWWHLGDKTRGMNRGWRFDYFLVSDGLKEKVTGCENLREVFGSDHCPVMMDIQIP